MKTTSNSNNNNNNNNKPQMASFILPIAINTANANGNSSNSKNKPTRPTNNNQHRRTASTRGQVKGSNPLRGQQQQHQLACQQLGGSMTNISKKKKHLASRAKIIIGKQHFIFSSHLTDVFLFYSNTCIKLNEIPI